MWDQPHHYDHFNEKHQSAGESYFTSGYNQPHNSNQTNKRYSNGVNTNTNGSYASSNGNRSSIPALISSSPLVKHEPHVQPLMSSRMKFEQPAPANMSNSRPHWFPPEPLIKPEPMDTMYHSRQIPHEPYIQPLMSSTKKFKQPSPMCHSRQNARPLMPPTNKFEQMKPMNTSFGRSFAPKREYQSMDHATANNSTNDITNATTNEETNKLFQSLSEKMHEALRYNGHKNSVEIFYMAAGKIKINVDADFPTSDNRDLKCEVNINSVLISTGYGPDRKVAKHAAFEVAIKKVCKRYLRVLQFQSGQKSIEASDRPFPYQLPNKIEEEPPSKQARNTLYGQTNGSRGNRSANSSQPKCVHPRDLSLGDFVLYEPQLKHNGCNAAMIMKMSTDFNRTSLDYDISKMGRDRNMLSCTLLISGQRVCNASGVGAPIVKNSACEIALQMLREHYCTIQIKPKNHDQTKRVTKLQLSGKVPDAKKAIPESNIGSKMMKMMGWEGGGIGKSGQGIAEPVHLESVIHREGLGLRNTGQQEFKDAIAKILHDYAISNDEKDLVFSTSFSKDERMAIHDEAFKLKLRSKYKCKDDYNIRYLVISRKRHGNQLYQQLWNEGGETETHLLVEAGEHEEL